MSEKLLDFCNFLPERRFSLSAGSWLLPRGHQEGGPLPVGCLVLSITYATLVSVAWMLGLCISSLWQNCCRPPYCPQEVCPWHSPTSTFCPVVIISAVAAGPASRRGASSCIGACRVTSVLSHLPGFCKTKTVLLTLLMQPLKPKQLFSGFFSSN